MKFYLLLLGILFISCGNEVGTYRKSDSVEDSTATAATVLTDFQKELMQLKFIQISSDTAREMVRSYVDTLFNARTVDTLMKDSITRSVLFDRSALLRILDANNPNSNVAGLRIYFSFYDSTKLSVKKYLQDRCPSDSTRYYHKFSAILVPVKNNGDADSTYLNLGGLCPPDCPGGWVDPLYSNSQ